MKVTVNSVDLYTVSEIRKSVIKHFINEDIFDADMKRRLEWVINHKYEQCYRRLKEEWDPKLIANGVQSVPTDPDAYAQLVFSQPNYKDRKAQEEASGE